jgi:acyl-CoA thioesterase
MAASFHIAEEGWDYQAHPMPDVAPPQDLPDDLAPEPRRQDLAAAIATARPARAVPDVDQGAAQIRRRHAASLCAGFFRKAAVDDWVLMDLQPESTSGGRGMYTGRIFTRDGMLAAGIAQETFFRPAAARTGPPAR